MKNFIKSVIVVIILCILVCGCSGSGGEGSAVTDVIPDEGISSATRMPYLPVKRFDGRKFKPVVVDIDPYNETFRMVYYVIESLKSDGWLYYEKLPFNPETDSDTLEMLNWLADNAQSEYLEFDKDIQYYTSVSSEEEIYNGLKYHIEELKDVDLILSLGTSPSRMLQEFDFDIPLLMYAVSDPVGSGLVKSAEDSGDKRYWAHVDSSAYSRQMKYYYETFEFKNIGSVYGDEKVSGLPQYRETARSRGFNITEYQLDRENMEENDYYAELKRIYRKMIDEDKVDAYILNTDVITDIQKAKELMRIFFDANIPVFVQVGSAYVAQGAALMIVDPFDASGTAPFVSYVIGAVLNGAAPGDIEQEYISSPYLTLNLDVADEIGFHPPFEMLIASEKIICEKS